VFLLRAVFQQGSTRPGGGTTRPQSPKIVDSPPPLSYVNPCSRTGPGPSIAGGHNLVDDSFLQRHLTDSASLQRHLTDSASSRRAAAGSSQLETKAGRNTDQGAGAGMAVAVDAR
jgi:hypothetical protein